MIKLITKNCRQKINIPTLLWKNLAMVAQYPYRFGGIQDNSMPVYQIMTLEKIFGKGTIEGFKTAYISVLQALYNKQLQFLKGVMEKGLTQNLRFIQAQLVHQNQPIDVSLGKIFFALADFERNNQNKKWVSVQAAYKNFQVFMSPAVMGKADGMKILWGCEIYFKGKPKLINISEQKKDLTESHMIQFEICKNVNLMTMMNLMTKIQSQKSKTNQKMDEMTKELFSIFIGSDYQWKIGDMDKVLNRNFQVTQGGGFGNLKLF